MAVIVMEFNNKGLCYHQNHSLNNKQREISTTNETFCGF
jgi:hypothetical protein